jgi:predicted permease
VLAYSGIRVLFAVSPHSVPRANEIGIDGHVLVFSLVVSLGTGILFGLAPLVHLTTRNLGLSLKEGGQRATAGSGRQLLRRLLVVSEIAASVMAVVVCGLLLKSFWKMQQIEPGFKSEGLTTFQIYLPETNYPEPADLVGFFQRLSTGMTALPGVDSASAMSGLPPRRRLNANDMDFEGIVPTPDGPPQNVDYWQIATAGYFETMEIPIVAGRAFDERDVAERTVVINETMARVFWPDQNPIGRRARPSSSSESPWFTIVGIAKDVKQAGLEEETGTECYFYYPALASAGFAPRSMNVVLRSSLPPELVARSARELVWASDDTLPLASLSTMDEVLAESLSRPRFVTLLLVVFAVLALLLAAVGTYGVMSYSVAERTSEIGIRMALGAGRGHVVRMVLSQGLRLATIGLVVGLVVAVALSRYVASFLYGVEPTDTVTFTTVPLVLLGVSLMACLVPAYRAVSVEPVSALRCE